MLMSISVFSVYADTNETTENRDSDSDGDGLPDEVEAVSTNTGVNSSTNAEVSSRLVGEVSNQRGAQVRVMQLMRNVEANIEGAEVILEKLRYPPCNCTQYDRMSQIVDSLDVVVIELEEFNYSNPSNEMARDFVSYKQDAVELTSEFRTLAREVLSEEEREEIREELQEIREQKREEFKEQIDERKREFQVDQFRELVVRLDIEGDEYGFVEDLESGNISIQEARQGLAQVIRDRNQEERQEALQRVREIATREGIEARERAQEIQEVVQKRAQTRNERLEKRLVERQDRVRERIENRNVASASTSEVRDNNEQSQQRLEEVRNERLERLNNRIDRARDRVINSGNDRPQVCTREYAPVCARPSFEGCPEGRACQPPRMRTYPNECVAKSRGAQIQYEGKCENSELEMDEDYNSVRSNRGEISDEDNNTSTRVEIESNAEVSSE